MQPSVKPAAHLRVEWLPTMPWNECPRSRGIDAHLSWNAHGMDIFAKNLKERAAQLGISNAQAARLCGLDERRYANYINNAREPDLATLAKIARTLQVSTDHLMGLTEALPTDERGRLLNRLSVSGASLIDDQLRMVVTQVEALAMRHPKKAGRRSPTRTRLFKV